MEIRKVMGIEMELKGRKEMGLIGKNNGGNGEERTKTCREIMKQKQGEKKE